MHYAAQHIALQVLQLQARLQLVVCASQMCRGASSLLSKQLLVMLAPAARCLCQLVSSSYWLLRVAAGQLDGLSVLSLGISAANTWISGTIPDALQKLRNLTQINLSNT
jgi:hypothetical protein